MKRLFRRVLNLLANAFRPSGLVRAAEQPFLTGYSPAPDWEPEHQRDLQHFLSSPTGRVFAARAQAVHADMAIRACGDSITPAHSAGKAAGFGDCIRWIDSLSRSSRAIEEGKPAQPAAEQATDDTHPRGATDLRERLAP